MSGDEAGHIRFLEEGDSSVLSAEGKEELSYIEAHPGFSNMADNDDEVNPPVVVDGQEHSNEWDDDGHGEDDDDDDEEEEVLDDAARAAALLKAETEKLARIATAKSLVKLTKKTLLRNRNNISPI
jgi:hypothetical protein